MYMICVYFVQFNLTAEIKKFIVKQVWGKICPKKRQV